MILACLAGAQFAKDASGNPTREAASKNILYRARSWILAESTLAAPAVIPPPLQGDPSGEIDEYTLYRDGPTNVAGNKINAIAAGFGLRNPDVDAATPDVNLKPVMTVVYHTTNEMLHAFRAGPCPACVPAETGGEELWGFVPFDLLGKLRDRMKPQNRANHTYMLASPVRFADVFVRGSFSRSIAGVTVSGDGVWRKVAIFGRGAGGKSLTAIDLTVPGPFTGSALKTYPPVVVWNRGNPDTSDGNCKSGTAGCTAAANTYNNTVSGAAAVSDYNAYRKMGETWSVPAMVFVQASSNTTPRRQVEFAAYAGSGFSDVTTEGKTFYALDALSGDVIASHDIANRASPPAGIPNHALVASPAAYQPDLLTAAFLGTPLNPAMLRGELVFFPDIHSRVWRFVTATPTVAPALFVDLSVTDGEQPVANAMGLAAANSDGSGIQPHLYLEAGNDSRIPAASPPFRMFAFRDVGGAAGSLFTKDFPSGFRGTVQPTVSFNQPDPSLNANDRRLRVFFAGTRFNPAISSCSSTFDSILFALTGVSGGAAYDLVAGGGAEESLTLTGQRISALQITGEQLVVDMGLGAQNPPPPPAPPRTITTAGGQKVVRNDTRNVPEAVPFRMGTTVCLQ
jgi:hypothetical protein